MSPGQSASPASYPEVLSEFEQCFDVVGSFRIGNSNAWPYVKNRIAVAAVAATVRVSTGHSRAILTPPGLGLVLRSLLNLCRLAFSGGRTTAYLGASTGISVASSASKDYYFPYYDIDPDEVAYLTNCGTLASLSKASTYLRAHRVVVENYLCGPMRAVLTRFMPPASSALHRDMEAFLATRGIHFPAAAFALAIRQFRAGFLAYAALFSVLRPTRAYVVSAYTKTDAVAALKARGAEVIELQHGIIGRHHPGYRYTVDTSRLPVPDSVDVYNAFWRDELLATGNFSERQIRIVGRQKYDELGPPDAAFARTIVFTGQATNFAEIGRFFLRSVPLAREQGLKLLYCPHPKETEGERRAMRELLQGHAEAAVYEGRCTTEHLIQSSLAHVSLFSACHFDAIHLKGRTFVLDAAESAYMAPYCDEHPDKFVRITTLDEILEAVTQTQ